MKYLSPLLLFLTLPVHAQTPEPSSWSTGELRATCIPAGTSGLQSRAQDCAVRAFGKLADLDGMATWYALYSNFPEPRALAAAGSALDFSNVLVLFEAASGSERLTPFSVSNPEGSFYSQFDTPDLLTTQIGTVLYVNGYGAGDGRGQFEYDLYMLWQGNGWTELNAFAWIPQVAARLPAGYRLDGIHTGLDLANLRYRGPVRRDEDCHTCATGGTVDVGFRLQENSLQLDAFRHDPDALWVPPP